MDHEKWIARSLTMWGALVTAMTASIPALNVFLQYAFGVTLEPNWVAELDTGVKAVIGGVGAIIGLGMVVYGRLRAATPLKWW